MKYTYNEAFNLITEAYINDKILPYRPEFCFCGTLEQGNRAWSEDRARKNIEIESKGSGFTFHELFGMEDALLTPLFEKIARPRLGITNKLIGERIFWSQYMNSGMIAKSKVKTVSQEPDYEEVLFEGMCTALEVMKQIYIARGLPVNDSPVFEKRSINTKNQVTC